MFLGLRMSIYINMIPSLHPPRVTEAGLNSEGVYHDSTGDVTVKTGDSIQIVACITPGTALNGNTALPARPSLTFEW